ncbi:hypothetical protein TNCV_2829751 [Trichonephila clavipes]|nr:hypothetical protein TNCV_2829751 [Trichonephila clavipes]
MDLVIFDHGQMTRTLDLEFPSPNSIARPTDGLGASTDLMCRTSGIVVSNADCCAIGSKSRRRHGRL